MSLAIQRFDRSAPLIDGTVPLDGITVVHAHPAQTGAPGVLRGEFDAAEVPWARYVFWRDQGEPVTAIPVFPDRLFLQQYVYTRPDTGIGGLRDLRGRKVILPGYFNTCSFWHRAALREEAGISPHEVKWYTTGPERDERMRLPEGVSVTLAAGSNLGIERLLDGTGDCLMTESTPSLSAQDRRRVKRVHADVHTLQREWYRSTGFHPILHVIVVRKEALVRWPGFGAELCRGYDLARGSMYQQLINERLTSLPLMRGALDETMELFGDDPWPYGLERNRPEVDRFLEYASAQGLTRRRLSPEELFDEGSLAYRFRSRMPP